MRQLWAKVRDGILRIKGRRQGFAVFLLRLTMVGALAGVYVTTAAARSYDDAQPESSSPLGSIAASSPAAAAAQQSLDLPPCVLYPGEPDNTYASFPTVTRTSDGRVMAVWRHSAGHQHGTGQIMFSEWQGLERAGDAARVEQPTKSDTVCGWSAPRAIAVGNDPGYTLGVAGLAGSGNTLVAGIVRYRVLSSTSARDFRAHYIRSTDGGATWSGLNPIHSGFGGHSYPASLVELPDGSLFMAFYGTDDPSAYAHGWHVRFARSTDGGVTWAPHGGTLRTESVGWLEPQLLVDGSRLLMTLRYDARGSSSKETGAFLAESHDNGLTWTEPRRLTTGTSGQPTLAKLHDGRYALAYRDLRIGGGFRYAVSDDLVSWEEGHDATRGVAGRMLYAGFASLGGAPFNEDATIVVYGLENPEGNPEGWANVYTATL